MNIMEIDERLRKGKYGEWQGDIDFLLSEVMRLLSSETSWKEKYLNLGEKVENLQDENFELKAEVKRLREENERLSKEWQQCHDLNMKYCWENQKLKKQIIE